MHSRIMAALAAATLVAMASPAHASTVETFDRSAFDGSPVASAAGWTMSAATSGELGGWLELSVAATDGTIPANGSCEPADVDAVLTVAPGEVFTIHTTADLCAHPSNGTPSLFGSFDAKQVSYDGSHKRARLVRDGFLSFGNGFLGAQGSVTMSVRW